MPAYQVALCEDEPMDRDQLAGLCREVFSSLTAKANDQFEESGAPKLLSGSVRVDGYNRHLDILYDAKILVSR